MDIALIGNTKLTYELLPLVSEGNNTRIFELNEIPKEENYDVIIDLSFDSNPVKNWDILEMTKAKYYLLGSVLMQLSLFNFGDKNDKVFGICNLATLISRSSLEYTSPKGDDLPSEIYKNLNFENAYRVEDRVGMVTPRVISMIVNEAYYTVQEGTANKSDIDLGMKLGTAYPNGPFEWAEKIGVENVYKVLKAVFEDTMDERYKICNLLKTDALKVKY